MKIRIKGNSVRLRLTKTEVETFGKTGEFNEETHLLGGVFRYQLKTSNEHSTLSAAWENLGIVFYMPAKLAQDWVNSNDVGHQHVLTLPATNSQHQQELFLLIEKDFVCLDNTFEDQSDNYPNPNAVC
ncbi:MAG: hypothetical protein NBV77_06470 [Bacteroidia bacterium]|nr:hypothetical protein [Bacteroidia bacterium]